MILQDPLLTLLQTEGTLVLLEHAGVASLMAARVHQPPLLGLVEGQPAAGADVAAGVLPAPARLRGHETADGA